MAKDVINVDGENKEVREDTAKSYRGIIWALVSVGAFIIVLAILVFSGILRTATDDQPLKSPGQIENTRH